MATNYAKATYQEIIDLNTTPDKPSIVGIHTPTGSRPYGMMSGFFAQFRKFRYAGCNVAIVPAAQLPADPLQVGYEAGEQVIDPRDLMNPILFHGAHGETLNTAFNVIYAAAVGNESESAVEQFYSDTSLSAESFYYTALSDPTFRKIGVMQGGMIKGLRPLIRPLALSRPLLPNAPQPDTGSMTEYEVALKVNPEQSVFPLAIEHSRAFVTKPSDTAIAPTAEQLSTTMFTSGVRRLGWLPTAEFTNSDADWSPLLNNQPRVTLPKLFMGAFIFPPAYKQKLAFRMIITHYFEFKEFTSALKTGGDAAASSGSGYQNPAYNWLSSDVTGGTLEANSVDGINVEARPLTEGVS